MQTRYQNLLDELHTNKRELSNYRQKYLSLQSELLALHEESRGFKKTISALKQTIQKLTEINKELQAQKQSILTEYSTSVESIKDDINKKQQEIYHLKQNSFSPLANQKLLEKQLRCQIENDFQQQLEAKDKRIRQLTEQHAKVNFDRNIDQEKHQLKVQALEKQLKQMQNAHLAELQNYANRTYQNSQNTKTSEEQTLIKKLRRQIDELRITLDSTKQQLHESINEKNQLHKQHSSFVTKHNREVEKYAEQLRLVQSDQKHQSSFIKQKPEQDQLFIKSKDKQIKTLKDQLQDLHEQLSKVQGKYSELQVELVSKENELKRHKEFSHRNENQRISELKTETQSYKRQLQQLKLVNENIRKQNLQLINSISDINIKSVNHITNGSHLRQNINLHTRQTKQNRLSVQDHHHNPTQNHKHNHNSKPSIIDEYEENQQAEHSFANLQRVKSSTNLKAQNLTKLQIFKKHYEEESLKNKELGHKYVELKKKYRLLEDKFNQANAKLMQLLKDKIQLNSPTAASQKSFHFPTSPQPKYLHSPEPIQNHQSTHENNHFTRTHGHLNPLRDLHFSPDVTISKRKRGDRSESQTKGGDQSFYQKSLRIKNSHKFKQIKCLNHDDPHHDHSSCSYSPIN